MFKFVVASLCFVAAAAIPTILHGDDHLANIDHLDHIDHFDLHTVSATPLVGFKTILQPETIHIHEPTIAKVGDLVQKVPTSVSHQTQTVVHNHADVVTPIVAPAVKTYTSHVVKAITSPVVYAASAPVLSYLHHE